MYSEWRLLSFHPLARAKTKKKNKYNKHTITMKQKYSLCAVIMLMTMMFALVPLRAQNTPPSCRVTITMQDQYGD